LFIIQQRHIFLNRFRIELLEQSRAVIRSDGIESLRELRNGELAQQFLLRIVVEILKRVNCFFGGKKKKNFQEVSFFGGIQYLRQLFRLKAINEMPQLEKGSMQHLLYKLLLF